MNSMLRTALALAMTTSLAITPAFAKEKAKGDAKAGDKESSFIMVNGKAVPKTRAMALMAAQNAQGQPDSPELRQAITEELVRREIISQEAIKAGFDKKPEVQGQMDLARQGVLVNAYLGDFLRKNPVADEQVKKEWEDIKSRLGNKEFKARHILVDSEDTAKSIIDKLKKGGKFEDLAKDSKDPGSKDRGGDLGWANPSAYVKPFAAALMKLEKGKFTDAPVKSDFGWHVIQLDDVRDLKLPSFDEAKAQIAQQLQQRAVAKHVEELRSKAKVE